MILRAMALGGMMFALPAAAATCATGTGTAAVINTASLRTLVWSPFGRVETGWETYAPRIAAELRTACAPATPGFAAALATWQAVHKLKPTGTVDAQSFAAMSAIWQARRPYVALRATGTCPPPPRALAAAAPTEGYLGKRIQLRPRALTAYRAMVAAARRDIPGLRRDARWLSIFSGYRDPASDAARCAAQHNCQGITRAKCSAHRTGLALDLYVGETPGFGPDSTADANRRAMTKTAAYAWLLANGARFGFVNYAFEPWHWEWTGETV